MSALLKNTDSLLAVSLYSLVPSGDFLAEAVKFRRLENRLIPLGILL